MQAKELQSKYEKQMKLLRDDLELQRKQEVHQTEERKNAHIRELMRKHRHAFTEIKNYYNDITSNNLDLIKTLKEDVAEMKKKEALNEKLMYEISNENKRLSEPLNRALKVCYSPLATHRMSSSSSRACTLSVDSMLSAHVRLVPSPVHDCLLLRCSVHSVNVSVQEVESLRQQVSNYDKNKMTLQLTKQRLVQADKQFKNLEWEKEVLSQRFAKVEAERNELYERFEASIFELQQKTGLRGALLERKLEAAYEVLEKKESQLAEILAASNLDAPTLQNVRTLTSSQVL